MPLSVTTHPLATNLVDRAQLRKEMGLGEEADPILDEMEIEVSAAVVSYCQRPFARAVVSETVPGFGGLTLLLGRTPVVAVATVAHDGTLITDYSVYDADSGLLYRALGWRWTAGTGWWLEEQVIPKSETPSFTVAYTAGYLLPTDDVGSGALSVDATDQSFNITGEVFPLLVAGDRIISSGFATAANNGTWTVVSRTATKIIVSEAGMVTELASANPNPKGLRVRTLPDDITRAAINTCKAWYIARQRDPNISSRSITGLSLVYAASTAGGRDLPPAAQAGLAAWRRFV